MVGRTRTRYFNDHAWGQSFIRSRQTWLAGKPYGPRSVYSNAGVASGGFEQTDDSVNRLPYPDTNFNLERVKINRIGTLSGTITDNTSYQSEIWLNRLPFGPTGSGDSRFAHRLAGGASSWKNRALATANPNRPDTDIINFLWELRDFTSLLHSAARKYVPRDVLFGNQQGPIRPPKLLPGVHPVDATAGIGIQVQFGWAPLLSDLQKLLGIADRIDRRLATLKSLTGKVVRSRYKLDDTVNRGSSSLTAIGGAFQGNFYSETRRRVWCVKKHTINVNSKLPVPRWSRSDAFNAAFMDDITITVWNSLPWSWLVDYFIDVGGLLAATGNRIPGYSVNSIAIMCERKTRFWTEVRGLISQDWNMATWKGNISHDALDAERVTLERYCEASPSPDLPDIGILSEAQFANLSFLLTAFLAGKSQLKISR